MSNSFFLLLGWTAVALGVIGILLPVLPTTPFLILAAFLFGKGSPRARAWLIDHAHLGPPIRDWEERGAISRSAKAYAVGVMGLVFAASVFFGLPGYVLAIQALCLGGAACFILTRPS